MQGHIRKINKGGFERVLVRRIKNIYMVGRIRNINGRTDYKAL